MKRYTRKVRVDLLGGPALNQRRGQDIVSRKRAKLGATQSWFTRRHGGLQEVEKKDQGWRHTESRPQGGYGQRGRKTLTKYSILRGPTRGGAVSGVKGAANVQQEKDTEIVATLLVPYSVDSVLMERMQAAEDKLAAVLGGEGPHG